MTATATLTRTTSCSPSPAPSRPLPVVFAGRLLGRPVSVEADRPLPEDAQHLLEQLDELWDADLRHSDLARITGYPNVVLSVAAPTRRLLANALAAVDLARRVGLDLGPCDAILDERHGRAGADPVVGGIMARLAVATAADLLAELCQASGMRAGAVRVGATVRSLDDPVEAALRQAASDMTRARRLRGGARRLTG
jgi:hypothetical protein